MKKIILTTIGFSLSSIVMATNLKDLPKLPVEQYTVVGKVVLEGTSYQKVTKSSQANQSALVSKTVTSKKVTKPSQVNQSALVSKTTASSQTRSVSVNTDNQLFAGDLIKRNELSLPERLNGSFIISTRKQSDIKKIAELYNLSIVHVSNQIALVKAPNGMELISLLSKLKADKRIASAMIEKVSNKMLPH